MNKKTSFIVSINSIFNSVAKSWPSGCGMAYGHRPFLFLCLLAVVTSCQLDLPTEAEGNRWELYRTLLYYKYIDRDTAKYAAARFLIDNMPYHYSSARILQDNDTLEWWRATTDSIYRSVVGGVRIDEYPWDRLHIVQKAHRGIIEAETLPDVAINRKWLCDIKEVTFGFLTDHIDNAFHVWRESPFARNLTFEEFKEYILPYRSVAGYGFNETGKRYNDMFAKYVLADSAADLRTAIQYYNTAVNVMRDINGKTRRRHPSGIYDLYSRDFHDCVDIANYGCNILRACGLPVVVEHNICYRSLPGCHYHCSVYNESDGTWQTFNAESSLPGDGDWAFAETANVYRSTYAAQKDTPPFLRADGEFVPASLNDPCMKDVTAYLAKTTSVTLPFKVKTGNKLAYLATFRKSNCGLIAVTWGLIDKKHGTVTFTNAMPGTLYFPVYYPNRNHKAFGKPFLIAMDGDSAMVRHLPYTSASSSEYNTLMLTRKYPRKPSMKHVAEELVGGRFIGSANGDFSDAVTLLEITKVPAPALLTYPLSHRGHYRSYRFQSSASHPHANISMLEWLAPDSHGYSNTMPAMRRHILAPSDTAAIRSESHLVRLMDADSWDRMLWKAEYDGNMQTAPSAYPNITLRLKEPQMVTHVRFAPKNADNGISAGDTYELHYWGEGWRSCGMVMADYEYVEFSHVPQGKLYWLENHSRGEEEMPFLIDAQGRQTFVYYDLSDMRQE